uniref:Acyl_transf_3 domain-containing protein n=1 Tax=Caenorhabditis tropicalis TaxID=1561998 RepID=A0A1I7V042_9PELO
MDSARNALLFESNRAVTEEESYFAKFALAIDLFTHTWSLSVEVQFYLLIPFVFLLAKTCLSDEYHMYYYTLLGSFSYLFSTFFCSEMESFNFMFARVWQFMTGMIVFEISEIIKFKEETKNEKFPMDSNAQETQSNQENMWKFCLLLIIGMAVIIVYPHEIPAKILRPFFTITTGTLMIFSRNNSFLSFPLLTYIGDISYSLYLLHWPIYAYWKLELSDGEIWNLELFEAILASFLLAILSYELYEKWYLKLSERTIAILCLILFFVVYLVIRKDDIDECMYPPANSSRLDGLSDDIPTTFEEAARINRKYVLNEVRNMKPPTCIYETIQGPNGWCSHTGLDKENGKYKIMIIGNSWAPNHGQLIYQECGSKAKSILQGSIGGCDPLVAERYNLDFCIENIRYFEKRIEEEQPDYVFLLTRFIDAGEPFSPNVTKTENDSIYIKMKRQLKIYLKSIKYKIFVMNQIPQTRSDRQAEIVNALRNGTNLAKFDKSFIHRRPFYARQRYDKLIEECEKCIQIDYNPLFWNTTTHTWRFYDEKNCGISYLTPGNHLTFHGLELIRPIYRDICTGL